MAWIVLLSITSTERYRDMACTCLQVPHMCSLLQRPAIPCVLCLRQASVCSLLASTCNATTPTEQDKYSIPR